ncbi:MAG: chemotaxis protein CheC [Chloroflexota bacterium]|nr:chemotaxis protein CheC [Chloroflexota bacterium]
MEDNKTEVHHVELSKWAELVGKGTQNAVLGLSEFVGLDITITALDLKIIPVSAAAELVGGAENEVVVTYVGITGGATGHIMLVYPKPIAFGLVDMLMGTEIGSTQELGDMEASALSEMGNITGTFFLNSMADNTGMRLMPTPPTVMVDMAGAILDAALAEIMMEREEMFAMETVFASGQREISGTLLVLPTAEFMDVMVEHNKAFARVQW